MEYKEVISYLKSKTSRENREGMARFGIATDNALGIPVPILRKLAKEIGKNHQLALELWESNIHEARLLATMIDNPKEVTAKQMESWVKDFNSWDICDQCCGNLFDKTPFTVEKIYLWSKHKEEFTKRAGFALMAYLAVHDKKMTNKEFLAFFPIIKREATDERNFVKKAVNWALRQIGKRNSNLQKRAIELAEEIKTINSPTAAWIAGNALSELKKKSFSN